MAARIIGCLTSSNYDAAQAYITRPANRMLTVDDLKELTYDDNTYMIAQIMKAKKGNWRRFPKAGDRSKAQKIEAPYDRLFMLR